MCLYTWGDDALSGATRMFQSARLHNTPFIVSTQHSLLAAAQHPSTHNQRLNNPTPASCTLYTSISPQERERERQAICGPVSMYSKPVLTQAQRGRCRKTMWGCSSHIRHAGICAGRQAAHAFTHARVSRTHNHQTHLGHKQERSGMPQHRKCHKSGNMQGAGKQ